MRRSISKSSNRKYGCRLVLCVTAGAIAASLASAEDGSPPQEQSKEPITKVEVIGKPVIEESAVNSYGSKVTTVSKDQIRELNAQDLPSALRRTPGVVISRHNPIGAFGGGDGGTVFIRGMGASRPGAEIVMTMDGVPRFVGLWTHPLMDILSVDNAARLDVYKGAQPVLFGNMAFGVVEIVTKRQTRPGFATDFQLAYGSYDTFIEAVEHGGKTGPVDYYLIQSFRSSDGHRANASGELQNYLARFGFDLNERWNLSLLFNRTDNWAKDPGDIHTGRHQGRFDTITNFGVVTLANSFERADGWVKLYWDNGAIDWVGQYSSATGANNSDTLTRWDNYGVKARETFHPWDGVEWTAGFDLDYISGKTWNVTPPPGSGWNFPRDTFRLIQPYAMIAQQFNLGDGVWLKPSIGVRGFFHDEYPDEFGPQAGVVLNIKDTRLHFGYARGVNFPGIFAKAQKAFIPPLTYADLTAETLNHFEAGLQHDFGKQLRIDLTGFIDNGRNRIIRTIPPPFPPTYLNRGTFETHGVEAMVTWRPLDELAFFASATWLRAEPADLPYTPKWTATVGASWRFLKGFTLSVDGSFVDNYYALSRDRTSTAANVRRVNDYFLLGARLAYEFALPWNKARAEVFIAGENLTDTNYEYKPGYPMPGVNVMGGFRVRF